MIDLTVEDDGEGGLCAKFSAENWELNVRASAAEFAALGRIESADWDARGSIRAGVAAGSPVMWSCSGRDVSVLIGHDDETWDIAFTIPLELAQRLARGGVELGHG
jgi:hypothetical protein